LLGLEAKPVQPRLALLELLILPAVDRLAPLVLGLVAVDLVECVVIDHDASGGALLERHLAVPGVLDHVAGVAQLAHLRRVLVEVPSALREFLALLSTRALDRQGIKCLKILLL